MRFMDCLSIDYYRYPLFPEAIAFNKDQKNLGIGCHHPKLFVLQREDSVRVVVTSANLVARQVVILFFALTVRFHLPTIGHNDLKI